MLKVKRPAKDVIVLKKYDPPKQSEGGIVIPESATKEPNVDKVGEVLHVGSDIKCVKVGDKVAFSHYGANVVNLGGEMLVFVKEENILAILE